MVERELPKRFVDYLRTLFDILDTEKSGYIKIEDIENRWQVDGEEPGLPSGVMDSLRKVTPLSGKLSFERFLAGLKIALLQSQHNQNNNSVNTMQESSFATLKIGPTATVPPNNATRLTVKKTNPEPRSGSLQNASSEPALNDLQDPQLSRMRWPQSSSALNQINDVIETKEQSRSSDDLLSEGEGHKVTLRRKESRRHTLTNGIDFNMIKRIKQWEQERDVLLSGISVIDNAREWYLSRLREVERKQKLASTQPLDQSPDILQDNLNSEISRIREINQLINNLSNARPLSSPLHTVASSQQTNLNAESNLIRMLKEQNRMLTQESADKSDKIAQLEKEKAQLILEIFKASSGNTSRNYDDTTFI
ncbi:hypothetical protein CAPTEDRAFT_189263 [Capitella teleta]|uniref:Suppressor APC domain-containing protein n=1 Tax=Capitella teleta TaxID=283909 RepID=R7UKL6_CAPTE|nr:hypothetical protein CAPTEDRAFT_189263 [Capitella teleta]|eukprot:ELU06628.1 hypothetical protein CAPTEDRAFT_189263 [Capitella teleta]